MNIIVEQNERTYRLNDSQHASYLEKYRKHKKKQDNQKIMTLKKRADNLQNL